MDMENVDALETLGVVMSNDGTADINVQKRDRQRLIFRQETKTFAYT